jgi:flagellar biosynthesis anti-sigma factor FlgM
MDSTINGVTISAQMAGQPTPRGGAPQKDEARPAADGRPTGDAVELSDAAREEIEKSKSLPVRTELVERIRAAINSGEYNVDDKLDAVVEELHKLLNRA